MRLVPKAYSLELGDWPGGLLHAFECSYDDAPDGGLDLVLPVVCPLHPRNVYWCPNAGVLWCDGGPVGWGQHRLVAAVDSDF